MSEPGEYACKICYCEPCQCVPEAQGEPLRHCSLPVPQLEGLSCNLPEGHGGVHKHLVLTTEYEAAHQPQLHVRDERKELDAILKEKELAQMQHVEYGYSDGCVCDPCKSVRAIVAEERTRACVEQREADAVIAEDCENNGIHDEFAQAAKAIRTAPLASSGTKLEDILAQHESEQVNRLEAKLAQEVAKRKDLLREREVAAYERFIEYLNGQRVVNHDTWTLDAKSLAITDAVIETIADRVQVWLADLRAKGVGDGDSSGNDSAAL